MQDRSSFDVAFEDPGRRVRLMQDEVALADGVCWGPCRAEPVGVRIGGGLGDGVEGEEVQGLHGAVMHRRHAQRTSLAVAFGNIHASPAGGDDSPGVAKRCEP